MAADPIPDSALALHDCQCTVAEAYAGRVDIVLTLEFLELQAGMRRIGAEGDSKTAARTAGSPATGSK
jgi:hypothetical protein